MPPMQQPAGVRVPLYLRRLYHAPRCAARILLLFPSLLTKRNAPVCLAPSSSSKSVCSSHKRTHVSVLIQIFKHRIRTILFHVKIMRKSCRIPVNVIRRLWIRSDDDPEVNLSRPGRPWHLRPSWAPPTNGPNHRSTPPQLPTKPPRGHGADDPSFTWAGGAPICPVRITPILYARTPHSSAPAKAHNTTSQDHTPHRSESCTKLRTRTIGPDLNSCCMHIPVRSQSMDLDQETNRPKKRNY